MSRAAPEILEQLRRRGIDPDHLAQVTHHAEADALDLLLHVAYNAPLVSRREQRAISCARQKPNFFNTYTPAARQILETLLDKYADYGLGQWDDLGLILSVPPFSDAGNPSEIIHLFGGPARCARRLSRCSAAI